MWRMGKDGLRDGFVGVHIGAGQHSEVLKIIKCSELKN